jgi:hypothetical protein
VRDKTKKIVYPCYDKKMHGFENLKEKFKRWRRNIRVQEFLVTIEMSARTRRLSCSLSGSGIYGIKTKPQVYFFMNMFMVLYWNGMVS